MTMLQRYEWRVWLAVAKATSRRQSRTISRYQPVCAWFAKRRI